jgi:hypothetical protein
MDSGGLASTASSHRVCPTVLLGDIPPRLDPPQPPVFPPFPPRSAAEIAAATAAAAEKAAAAATAHAKQWAANMHPEMVAAAARGAPRAPGLELEADGAVGCWLTGAAGADRVSQHQIVTIMCCPDRH